MPRRVTDTLMLCCPVTVREQLVIEMLKTRCGITSNANLVRKALKVLAVTVMPREVDGQLWVMRTVGGHADDGVDDE